MIEVFAFLTPIIAFIFFMNCVTIAKKLKNNEDVHNRTIIGAIMFALIILSIIWSILMSS